MLLNADVLVEIQDITLNSWKKFVKLRLILYVNSSWILNTQIPR